MPCAPCGLSPSVFGGKDLVRVHRFQAFPLNGRLSAVGLRSQLHSTLPRKLSQLWTPALYRIPRELLALIWRFELGENFLVGFDRRPLPRSVESIVYRPDRATVTRTRLQDSDPRPGSQLEAVSVKLVVA